MSLRHPRHTGDALNPSYIFDTLLNLSALECQPRAHALVTLCYVLTKNITKPFCIGISASSTCIVIFGGEGYVSGPWNCSRAHFSKKKTARPGFSGGSRTYKNWTHSQQTLCARLEILRLHTHTIPFSPRLPHLPRQVVFVAYLRIFFLFLRVCPCLSPTTTPSLSVSLSLAFALFSLVPYISRALSLSPSQVRLFVCVCLSCVSVCAWVWACLQDLCDCNRSLVQYHLGKKNWKKKRGCNFDRTSSYIYNTHTHLPLLLFPPPPHTRTPQQHQTKASYMPKYTFNHLYQMVCHHNSRVINLL